MAQKKIPLPVSDEEIDTGPGIPDKNRRTAHDAKAEIDRFCTILKKHLRIVGKTICIDLSSQVNKKPYPLFPRNEKNDPVRAWAMEQYAEEYGDDNAPRIDSYKLARSRIERETDLPQDADSEGPQERGQRPGRASKRVQNTALIEAIDAVKDWSTPSRKMGVSYARVPWAKDINPELIGLWRLDPEDPSRLLDCEIRFKDLNRPHAIAKSLDYSGTLLAVNAQGERKDNMPFTSDELEDKGGLDKKFVGFGDWPTLPTDKYRLLECLKHLMREKGVAIHDQYMSLGWVKHPELGLVWLGNNGLETEHDFIPSEQAPFAAPALMSPGNGYKLLTSLPAWDTLSQTDVWSLFLTDFNPYNYARAYAKLGAIMRVMFPEGTVEKAGKLNSVIETIGFESGQGKSAEDNYFFSLFGADFTYERPPFLSVDDTSPTRPKLMERLRFCAFGTEDRKARDELSGEFLKQHMSRKKIIEQYSDDIGGGLKSTAYGRDIVSRGNPQGIPFLTGNADHSAYAFKNQAGGEEMIEWRACTFILSPREKSSFEVSKKINAQRHDLTAWGAYERRWIMQQCNRDESAFMLRIQTLRAQAEERVFAICSEWPHTRPQNVCIDLVWGALAHMAFLEDMCPDNYQDQFLWQWLDTMTEVFIENRIERARYLQSLIDKREDGNKLEDFVLDGIRYLLGTSAIYIATQQDQLLSPDDVPCSLTAMGYKHSLSYDGNEQWGTTGHKTGYYLARKDAIAFNDKVLYPLLEVLAMKQKVGFPSKQDFKRAFAETGVPEVKRDEEGEPLEIDHLAKVGGTPGRYIIVSFSKLYPVTQDEDEDEEDEMSQEADEQKIIPIRRAETRAAVGDQKALSSVQVQGSSIAVMERPEQPVQTNDFSVNEEDIPEED